MLITPIDIRHGEDYGEIDNYHSFKDIYTGFVDYLTNSKYPSIKEMKDMTDIRERVKEVNKSDSIYNNKEMIDESRLMIISSEEYKEKLNLEINNKEKMNEYHNLNIFRLHNKVQNYGNIMLINNDTVKYIENNFINMSSNNKSILGIS
jgi:hypothetical protein